MSVMHGRRAGLGGLRNEHAEKAIEIQTFRQRENRLLKHLVLRRNCTGGVKQQAWEAICYRAVCELVTSARRGT